MVTKNQIDGKHLKSSLFALPEPVFRIIGHEVNETNESRNARDQKMALLHVE